MVMHSGKKTASSCSSSTVGAASVVTDECVEDAILLYTNDTV